MFDSGNQRVMPERVETRQSMGIGVVFERFSGSLRAVKKGLAWCRERLGPGEAKQAARHGGRPG
jgi:hypothetical protein